MSGWLAPGLDWMSSEPGADRLPGRTICDERQVRPPCKANKVMNWHRRVAMLLIMHTLTGCAPSAGGSGQAPTAPYQQQDPRDTSGMH